MKKNVVRITESELKQYIKKVISEQTAPAPQAVDLSQVKSRIIGKNVLMFTDVAEPNGRGSLVRIETIESNNDGGVSIGVRDLKFFDEYGNPKQNQGTRILSFPFFCTNPKSFNALTDEVKYSTGPVNQSKTRILMYSKLLQGILLEGLNCAAPQNVTTQDLGQQTLK